MNKYVVLTINGVTPSSGGLSHDCGEFFPAVYDVRIVSNSDKELKNQIRNLIDCRSNGVIGSFEVGDYNPSEPKHGWVIDVYDRQCSPLYRIKCIRA